MKEITLLFPGQGAQSVGMARDFFDKFDSVRKLFQTASTESGFDCEQLLFNSSDEELKETEKTQVAVTLANLAAFYALKEHGLKMEQVKHIAGFSLGEYAALCASGVIDEVTCFRLVRERGRLMAKAGKAVIEQKGSVGMAAVMGLSPEQVEAVLDKAAVPDVFCANYNSPSQLIISGLEQSIDAVEPLLKEAGAKRVLKLKVSGPFHTPLLESAAREFGSFLETFTFNNPKTALYSNVTGALVTSGDEAKQLLIRQISNPVRWISIEQAIKAGQQEPCLVLECGPGTVLSGLWKALFGESAVSAGKLDVFNDITL